MSMPCGKRALHIMLNIGNRSSNYNFFVNILGMKVLRHEEFAEGCPTSCTGTYDGHWSKTVIGYGAEDNHFVLELAYNYGVRHYPQGDDLKGITIQSSDVFKTFNRVNYIQRRPSADIVETMSPDRYPFSIVNNDKAGDPLVKISLASSDLEKTVEFWSKKLDMTVLDRDSCHVLLSYGAYQAQLEFIFSNGKLVNHADAIGHIAFSSSRVEIEQLEQTMRTSGYTIFTPHGNLGIADPDGYKVCFVDTEAFHETSQVNENAERLLVEAINTERRN